MPVFHAQIHPEKRKKTLLLGYFFVMAGLALFVVSFYLNKTTLPEIFYAVLSINAIISGIGKIRGRKQVFIQITDEGIKGLVYEKSSNEIIVAWKDIHWIKKEKDGDITIYRASSFSDHFFLKDFSEEDKTEIYQQLQSVAVRKQVHLINFSQFPLAVA